MTNIFFSSFINERAFCDYLQKVFELETKYKKNLLRESKEVSELKFWLRRGLKSVHRHKQILVFGLCKQGQDHQQHPAVHSGEVIRGRVKMGSNIMLCIIGVSLKLTIQHPSIYLLLPAGSKQIQFNWGKACQNIFIILHNPSILFL